jgi:uncharacterized protein (DUF2267 family)
MVRIMSSCGLEVFDRTVQETNVWLGEIADDLGPDRQVAYRVLRAVLHALRDRLPVEQAAHLSAQLPMLIRGIYYEAYQPAKTPTPIRSRAEFLSAVSDELSDIRPVNAEEACLAVFDCMRRHVSPGQLEKVFWSLPEHVRQVLASADAVKGGA